MKLRVRKKVKDSRRAAGKARGKGVEKPVHFNDGGPRNVPAGVTTERIKTSIIVERKLMQEAQEFSRLMGLSYNGFINLAIYEKLRSLDSVGQERPPASLAPEMRDAFARRPRHTPAPPLDAGYSLPNEDGSAPDVAPWDVVERYARLQLKHPTDDFIKMAKRMNIPPGVARAADIAQESEEYRRYLKRKAKAS